MGGFQFIHLESWSRKPDDKGRSTSFILDEASRKPIASVHVPDPKPPIVIYGVGIEEVRQMHDVAASLAMTTVKGKPRKIRLDQKTLHTVVASHPYTVEEARVDKAKATEVLDWERRTVAWLRDQYGPALKCVIRHIDEKQCHVHAYVLPSADPELRAMVYHPGTMAKRAVKADGRRPGEDGKALNKRADHAYKSALRAWQDSYQETVAASCGLTRLGPARRRLTREQWKAEQAQAAALKNAVERAAAVKAHGQAYIDRTKDEAAAILADAMKVKAMATRLQGVGGAVRAVVDGIQESRVRDQIRREFARDLDTATAAAKAARADVARERASRRESERTASDARHAVRQSTAQLADAKQEIRRLSDALAAALDEPMPTLGVPTL
ncbi:hypothetical protein [Rhizobium sp. 2TAF27]|uniref:hypothetical protein n=1 Tax=Rhizobium sp. 2TAF27 TaxID=3233013 RepID=UPI003F99CC78